jgi:hypothetical protein
LFQSLTVKAQTKTVCDTLLVNPYNSYKISSLNIIPFTEKIFIGKKILSKKDYKIFYETGAFQIIDPINISLMDSIFISYKTIQMNLPKEYKRRSLIINYKDKENDTIRVSQKVNPPITTESIFGKDIQKSGALVRGFTLGTNKDFTLNSGLRLQLSGKLSDDIEIVAALTDENTPIQPEGNTETLEELDKVFIELRHKNAIGTFGDYELNERQSEFTQVTRKLQGLKGEFILDKNRAVIAIAGSRGKFNTNQFNGQDGNQGPYRLYGVNNEKTIIIIAGSEKIYLDGELLKRGENNDYIIDYSFAEITFTPKRLITSASRISVDFEYTDQNYKRNFFGSNVSTNILNDKLQVGLSYFREGDDENNPIDFTFSEDDKKILQLAGDNRNAAVRSGVTLAQPDSLGRILGIYSKIDTTINLQPYAYYFYSPGAIGSIYNVTFSYVGEGNGDYIKESLGKYKFAGINKGAYSPIVFLPMPELKQVGSINLIAVPIKGIKLNVELAGSSWDKNRLSNLDDSDNLGYARKIILDIEPAEIKIGSVNLGKAGFNFKDRFIESKFATLDRIDAVEFNRFYNLNNAPASDQILREVTLNYSPVNEILLNSKYGYLKQSENFISNRFYNEIKYDDTKKNHLEYIVDYVSTENNLIKTKWNRQNGKTFFNIGLFQPGVEFLYENKEEKIGDSTLVTSYNYVEAMPNIQFTPINSFFISAGYSYREESFPLNNKLELQSKSYTQKYSAEFRGLKEFTTSMNVTFRNKNYTEAFQTRGYSNNETVLFLSQSRFNLWSNFIQGDLYYQAATEQSAHMEKVFVKVPRGTGSYIYLGDLNNNGIAEENEFQLSNYDADYILVTIPTDQLFPVMDLKANTRWRINFDKVVNGQNLFSKFVRSISTETFWRIEENSKEKDTKQIYLMNLSRFLNDSTTIRGSQLFQHDINFFQNSSEFSVRFRFTQRKSLNQYSAGIDKGFFKERGIRIRFKLIPEITNQTEFTNQIDNLISPPSSNRARTVTKNDLTTDFSYRPYQNIEIGFKIQTGASIDAYPSTPTNVDMNSLMLRLNLSFENFGRLRIEVERTELISNNSFNIPFEITRGNVVGKNYFWRAFFDYKIASYIQTSLNYDARLQGNSRVIHTMRAEAKAYF